LPPSEEPSETQQPFARTLVTARTWPFLIDLGVAACALALFFAIVSTGAYWLGKPVPVVPISHSISALPLYAFYSIVRMAIAYLLSLVFAITYGYIAAYNPRIEAWMIAVLDILQSIPVLSFLPPVVLAMVASFPATNWASRWASSCSSSPARSGTWPSASTPRSRAFPGRCSKPRASTATPPGSASGSLKCPYAAIGLVWNSIVSVAGGWFALIACEMFTMGERNFQLPGLGSYLQTAFRGQAYSPVCLPARGARWKRTSASTCRAVANAASFSPSTILLPKAAACSRFFLAFLLVWRVYGGFPEHFRSSTVSAGLKFTFCSWVREPPISASILPFSSLRLGPFLSAF
jgi:hypothetical protein